MKIGQFIFWFLLAIFFCGFGCCSSKPTPDPLAGWKPVFVGQPNETIEKDYQNYIHKLPPGDRKGAGAIFFFENGTGQHAVQIETAHDGAFREHVLIYDKNDRQIKVITYSGGKYRS